MTADDQLLEAIRRRAMDATLRTDVPRGELPAVASPEVVARAERVVGHTFPTLLRRAYLEVADGGFGPGYGLLPIGAEKDTRDTAGETILGEYRSMLELPAWPRGLLLAFDFGCAIWSCVDVTSPQGAIVNMASLRLADMDWTLADWFGAWVSGRNLWDEIHQPGTEIVCEAINPFTKERMVMRSAGLLRGRLRPPLDPDFADEPR